MFRDDRFEVKSLNSHFQRIYRPHRIEEENDKLTLPRISVSTDDGKIVLKLQISSTNGVIFVVELQPGLHQTECEDLNKGFAIV